MSDSMCKVKEFMVKFGYVPGHLEDIPKGEVTEGMLRAMGKSLQIFAKEMEPWFRRCDVRLLRGHLMMEELGELLEAMADLDELGVLDGLADLEYVTKGTAIQFDLPLDAAFDEVHRANMTKERVLESDTRLRRKGMNWNPPDLIRVLDHHRQCQADESRQDKFA